jgi:hypothetical protein
MDFIFETGLEAVCPSVQPLLMVDRFITKVCLMDFVFEAGREAVCPRVEPRLMVC